MLNGSNFVHICFMCMIVYDCSPASIIQRVEYAVELKARMSRKKPGCFAKCALDGFCVNLLIPPSGDWTCFMCSL